MRKPLVVPMLVVTIAATAGAWYHRRAAGDGVSVTTAAVTRGDVVQTVRATGTLEASQTVQIGTQVSGRILELGADYNTIVRRGQVLARLDPSLLESAVEQARASRLAAAADVERLEVAVDDARIQQRRTEELAAKQLVAETDREAAAVAVRTLDAQRRSAQAALAQADAVVASRLVDLEHATIRSPIDGIVISRDVDVGQTVAASLSAPTLFTIAADLTHLQVDASVDEADVGQVAPGQAARFTVDAFPAETFTGTVSQIQLQPVVTQEVVTYTVVIDVSNPALELRPGMTATVTLEVARRVNVPRVSNTALRFRPTDAILAALGQPSREAQVETSDRVWLWVNGALEPAHVSLGATDGTYTELLGDPPGPGAQLVTGVSLGDVTPAAATASSQSPLLQGPSGMPPPPPPGAPPPGGF